MRVYRHPNHIVYTLYRNKKKSWKGVHFLKLIQYPRYYIYKKGAWLVNFRFNVYLTKSFKYTQFQFKFPFFIFTKDNCNIKFGCNRLHLWIQF